MAGPALLAAPRAEAETDQAYLFPGNAPGKPVGDIKAFWRHVCRDAGLEGVRLHDLRHTYASSLVSRGVSLHIVSRLLGHTQPQTTARYAHLDDHSLREATNGFGRLVEGAGQGREAEVVELDGPAAGAAVERRPRLGRDIADVIPACPVTTVC